jgi:hypothetical protein
MMGIVVEIHHEIMMKERNSDSRRSEMKGRKEVWTGAKVILATRDPSNRTRWRHIRY